MLQWIPRRSTNSRKPSLVSRGREVLLNGNIRLPNQPVIQSQNKKNPAEKAAERPGLRVNPPNPGLTHDPAGPS
jgi:hypothetical protein